MSLRSRMPVWCKKLYWKIRDRNLPSQYGLTSQKMAHELRFWESQFAADNGHFRNGQYEPLMMAMSGQSDQSFLEGKIVADFGCGPRGSLEWANKAKMRIGIDVLADQYSRFGISKQNMCYVVATESKIPLPTSYVDLMFTLNAMDHVDNFDLMCKEILRVLTPGGLFIGSFNLDEPPTEAEPQTITEEMVDRYLLREMHVTSRRLAPGNNTGKGSAYIHCMSENPPPVVPGEKKFFWVRATKPAC